MNNHNLGVWEMPGELEAYIGKHDAAKAAWRKLSVALDTFETKIKQARANPDVLAHPGLGAWPTQEQLKIIFEEAQRLTIPLAGDYHALPQNLKNHAPQPDEAKQNSFGRGPTFR